MEKTVERKKPDPIKGTLREEARAWFWAALVVFGYVGAKAWLLH
jgi:hypothetical protein